MWYHEIEILLEEGKTVRRLSWPKDDAIKKTKDTIDLSELDLKPFGIPTTLDSEIPKGTLVYCTKKTASIGYTLTSEDKNSQDWEVVA